MNAPRQHSPDQFAQDGIRILAERALALSGNDIVRAVEILGEWTGLGFDAAFMAVEAVVALDDAQLPDCAAVQSKDAPL